MKALKMLSLGLVLLGLSASAYAQRGGGGNYNTATETTLTGSVDEIKTMPSQGRGGGGLHLILGIDSGSIEVHVGPTAYVSSENMTFEKGDSITVVG